MFIINVRAKLILSQFQRFKFTIQQQLNISCTATYTVIKKLRVVKAAPLYYLVKYTTLGMSDVPAHDEEMSSSSGAVTDETGPTTVEQSTDTSIADPEPGSVPLINEQGNPKFPRALLERGGYDMLRMSLNKGLPAWVTAANVLELNVSIETVLLNIVWYALQSQDADIVSMLRLYDWFPSGLLDVHQSKRTVRWDWIMSKDPGEPAIPGSLPPALHCFWAKGFGVSKAKDEMLIKADVVKSLNFKSFRTILLSVSDL